MQIYKDKTIAILGLSVEGLDSVQFFHKQGAQIWCCDNRTKEQLGKTYDFLVPMAAGFQLGSEYLMNLDRFDYIVRTPGMSPRLPERSEEHTSELQSHSDLVCRLLL